VHAARNTATGFFGFLRKSSEKKFRNGDFSTAGGARRMHARRNRRFTRDQRRPGNAPRGRMRPP
jgi:hypothetical protein